MKYINLFGEEQEFNEIKQIGKFKSWHKGNNYRKSETNSCCKICQHLLYKRLYKKGCYKCELQGNSNSSASDVRVSYVCNLFKGEGDTSARH